MTVFTCVLDSCTDLMISDFMTIYLLICILDQVYLPVVWFTVLDYGFI